MATNLTSLQNQQCSEHSMPASSICLLKSCPNNFHLKCDACLRSCRNEHQTKIVTTLEFLQRVNRIERSSLHKDVGISLSELQKKISLLRNFRTYIMQKEGVLFESQQEIQECVKQFCTEHEIIMENVTRINRADNVQEFDCCLEEFKPFLDFNKINNTIRIGSINSRSSEQILHQNIISSLTLVNDIREYLLKIIEVLMSEDSDCEDDRLKSSKIDLQKQIDRMMADQAVVLEKEINNKIQILGKLVTTNRFSKFIQKQDESKDIGSILDSPEVMEIIAAKDSFHQKLIELNKDYVCLNDEKVFFENHLREKETHVDQLLQALNQAQNQIKQLAKRPKTIPRIEPKTELQNMKGSCDKLRADIETIKGNLKAVRQEIMEEVCTQVEEYSESSVKVVEECCSLMDCDGSSLVEALQQIKESSCLFQSQSANSSEALDQLAIFSDKLTVENEKLKQNVKGLHQKIKFHVEEAASKQSIEEELNESVKNFGNQEIKVETMSSQLAAQEEQMAKLSILTLEREEEIQGLTGQIEKLSYQVQELESEKQVNQDQSAKNKEKLVELERQAFVLNEDNVLKSKTIAEFHEMTRKNLEIERISKSMVNQESMGRSISGRSGMNRSVTFSGSRDNSIEARHTIDSCKKQAEQTIFLLKNSIRSKETMVQSLHEQINRISDQKKIYQELYFESEKEENQLKQIIDESEVSLMELKCRNNQLENLAIRYEETVCSLQNQLKAQEGELEEFDKEKFEYMVKIDQMNKEIYINKGQIKSLKFQSNDSRLFGSRKSDNEETPTKERKLRDKSEKKTGMGIISLPSEETQSVEDDQIGVFHSQKISSMKSQRGQRKTKQNSGDVAAVKRKNMLNSAGGPNKQEYEAVKRLFLTVNNDVLALQQKLRDSSTIQRLYEKQLDRKRNENKRLKTQLAKSRKNELLADTRSVLRNPQSKKNPLFVEESLLAMMDDEIQ